MELFLPIKDFETLYEISNKGNVKALKRKYTTNKLKNIERYTSEKILKPSLDGSGYQQVILSKNGSMYSKKIHRLVAESFIENPNNYNEINHKDEDKTNNNVENLEWCDRQYNVNYGNRTNKTKKKVYQYDLNKNLINTYNSLTECCNATLFPRSSISNACINQNTFRGYLWTY